MSERSIVAKLRLDISDLRANARAGKAELASVAAASEKANKAQSTSSLKVAESERIRAATRHAAAVQEIRANEQAIASAAKYGKATALIREHEQSLKTLGGGLTKVGLTAALGFGVAVKSAADFDQGMSDVAATGDDAKKNLGALRAEALQLGADTKFSATEAAAGVENLLKAGVSAQDTLGGGLKGALDLAAAGQISVADASETAATALTQFKLRGQDVPHVADLLAAGAGKAQGEVSDMAAALKQSGLVASQFGLSIEDTTGTLSAFASAGLIGSDAGTSFKTMLLALSNPSKESRAQMDALGISAYDAQGKFVGITNLAEQLKNRLSGLTEEQRNAALAQIFGNDAIRAANVLYTEGASGITSWIGKVNDQGYAAETAATKMDNLKGDLEQLKGALSTALIGGGDGSTAALRDITQLVTRLVNGFNDLDPATQASAVKVLALVAALGLGGGAVIKLVTSLAAARTALIELGAAAKWTSFITGASGAAAATTALAAAATGAAAAYGVLVGGGMLVNTFKTKAASVDELSNAISAMGTAVPAATTDLDRFFSLSARADLGIGEDSINGLADAFDRVGNRSGLLKANDVVTGFLDKIGGADSVLNQTKKRFTDLDQVFSDSFSKGDPQQAALGFQQVANMAAKAQIPIGALVDKYFPEYKKQLEAQATDLHVAGLSAEDYADWMAGTVPPAIAAAQAQQGVSQSAKDLTPALASARAALVALNQDTKFSADQSAQLAQQVFAEGDAYQNTIGAHASYAEAIDQASATMAKNGEYLTKNGKALSDNTAAGRENIAALGQLASSGKDYVRSLIAQGASADDAADATAKVRREFVDAARAAGLSKGAAADLADSYGLIPKKVSTEFDAFGLALQQQKVADYQNALAGLPDEVRANIEAIYHKDGAEAAIAELDRITGKPHKAKVEVETDTSAIGGMLTELGRLKDKKVKATAAGDTAGAKKVDAAMKALRDRIVKALTKGDKSGSDKVDKAQRALRDKLVKALTRGDISGAQKVLSAIRNLPSSKTTTLTTVYNKIYREKHEAARPGANNAADGGPIYLADGGPGGRIQGNGGPREDNIAGIDRATGLQTSWVSNGEFVTNARAYAANQQAVEMINAGKGQRFKVTPLADGGQAGLFPGLASGGSVTDAAIAKAILAMIASRTNAIADIKKAQAALAHENAVIAKPKATLDAANARLTRNKDRQQDLKERVADLKRAADATKGTTKADRQYKKALADLRDANNAVSRSTTDKKKAQEAYDAVSEKSKAAADALKQAQDALAESARGVSNAFRDSYMSKSTDVGDVLQLMKDGTKDLTSFTAQVRRLRSLGLNETTLQQVVDMQQANPQAGADLATQITAGGKGLVAQLNSANSALQKAADNLGYLAATGIQRKAGGGLVHGDGTGTSNSVLLRGSAGEFMQPDAAVRHYGVGFMQDVQHLRYTPAGQLPGAANSGTTTHIDNSVHIDKMLGGDPYAVARAIDNRQRDRMAAAGMSVHP